MFDRQNVLRMLTKPRPSLNSSTILSSMSIMSNSDNIVHFYNRFHIGDNLLNLKFFMYISSALKSRGITIYYYYNQSWRFNTLETLRSYIDPSVVVLKTLDAMPTNSIELWMGNPINDVNCHTPELYYELLYKNILNYVGINDSTLTPTLWLEEPFLVNVYDALDSQYKDIDILILNTTGHSGQYNDNKSLNQLAIHLSKRFNIVTADPIEGITSANTLSLQQIGAISTRAKYIISTCSGPQVPCHNKYTKDYVKKWFFITSGVHFRYPSIDYIHTVMDTAPIQQFFDNLIVSR